MAKQLNVPAVVNSDEKLYILILYSTHHESLYFYIVHSKMTTAKLKSMEKLLQEEVEKFRSLQKGKHASIMCYQLTCLP